AGKSARRLQCGAAIRNRSNVDVVRGYSAARWSVARPNGTLRRRARERRNADGDGNRLDERWVSSDDGDASHHDESMHLVATVRSLAAMTIASLVLVACGKDSTSPGDPGTNFAACPAIDFGPKPAALTLPQATPAALAVLGNGLDTVRYQAEVAVRGTTAYTTSWSVRRAAGNKVSIWDVSGNVPLLVDSLILNGVSTTGDVAVSDDGRLLVVATERTPGAIVVYDLTNPRKPTFLSVFTNTETNPGVHTAEVGRVNGKLYAFLAIDPLG